MPPGLTPQMPKRPPPLPLSPEARASLKSTAPPGPPPLPPRRRPPPLPDHPPPPPPSAEQLTPTRPRSRHVRGGELPSPQQLQTLPTRAGTHLVNPELFSVLERYKQADRGALEKGIGRMFSTRPGASAIAPTTAATPQQLQAAGTAIGLVSQLADAAAQAAAIDAEAAGERPAQQEVVGNRARAAVWEKSGVPVDMRPLRAGVLGAEISKNRAAFLEERVSKRGAAALQADKVSRGLVTKERALKATLKESDAGVAVEEAGLLAALAGVMPELTLDDGVTLAGGAQSSALQAFKMTHEATDPLVKTLSDASSALGGGLSIIQAMLQLKVAAEQAATSMVLDDLTTSDRRSRDRARDVMIDGASEVAMFKAGISAGKSIGSMISAMGGVLFATPAGPVLKIVGAAIGGAMTVTDITKDSYQAGKVVEKEFEARYHGDGEESAEYVLRYGGEHRAESLLRKARGKDRTALRALAVFGIGAEELASQSDEELRAKVIKAQGVATKNIGTRVSEGVSGIGTYFSDAGGAMIQHYRGDIAERTARAKDLMLYGDAASGKTHNMTKVRAGAFFRTGPQVDNERKAQLEILKLKIAKRNHGLDPKTLEQVMALLQPQSHYQALKADHARKLAVVKQFGPGTSISSPRA